MSKIRFFAAAVSLLLCLSLAACHAKENATQPSVPSPLPDITQNQTPEDETDTQDQQVPGNKEENTPDPSSIHSPMTVSQRQEIQAFLNDPANAGLMAPGASDSPFPVTALGGEIDTQGNFLIAYDDQDYTDGITYVMTLEKTDAGYHLLSNGVADRSTLETLHKRALAAYDAAPERERNIGNLQPETMSICRLDDGKYYQISLATNHDCVRVFVSQNEVPMSAFWDWLVIGEKTTFTIDHLGKVEESGRNDIPSQNGHVYK